MTTAPFLLASKELLATNGSGKVVNAETEIDDCEEEESQGIREWQLASAQHALIIDDYTSYNLFKTSILAAPQEETLEDFYYSLGAPLLSTLVEEAARHGPVAKDQSLALKLQKQIYERSRIFLHDQPGDAIKHDTKWLEKNLKVQAVSSISLRRSLKGRNVSHTEKRSAVVTQISGEYTLWITGEKTDLYQVSQALVHLLLSRPKLHSALTLEMLLKTDLLDLRARGFNVGRILRQKAAEARMAQNLRQQQMEDEQKRVEEEAKAWEDSQGRAAKERAKELEIPGDFPDSPDRMAITNSEIGPATESPVQRPKPSKNILSNLSKQLGFGDGRASRHLQNLLGNSSSHGGLADGDHADQPPPPYTSESNTSKTNTNPSQAHPHPHPRPQALLDPPSVTAPHQMQ